MARSFIELTQVNGRIHSKLDIKKPVNDTVVLEGVTILASKADISLEIVSNGGLNTNSPIYDECQTQTAKGFCDALTIIRIEKQV